MPRKPVISRTIEALQVLTLRTDTKKEKVKHESFIVYGSFANNERLLKKIRQDHDDDRMITSRIKTVQPVTLHVKMSIQAFIDNAEEIEILTKEKNK